MPKSNKEIPLDAIEELNQRRLRLLDECYIRLEQLIPECTNESTLLKCIEVLEKRQTTLADSDLRRVNSITDTLERLKSARTRVGGGG